MKTIIHSVPTSLSYLFFAALSVALLYYFAFLHGNKFEFFIAVGLIVTYTVLTCVTPFPKDDDDTVAEIRAKKRIARSNFMSSNILRFLIVLVFFSNINTIGSLKKLLVILIVVALITVVVSNKIDTFVLNNYVILMIVAVLILFFSRSRLED